MASTTELLESWQRLDLSDLQAIAIIVRSEKTATVSARMQHFLATSLNSEADHREDFKVKPDQVPQWDDWNDDEVADGYFAALMIERAADGGTERLQEWAELLRSTVCLEMASRLRVRFVMKGVDPCQN